MAAGDAKLRVCNFCSPSTCVEQHNTSKACIIHSGVVWLGSPAAIALSLLCTKEAICKFTTWYILIPVRGLPVSYMVIDNKINNSTCEFWLLSLGFPSFKGLTCCLYTAILYVIMPAAAVNGNLVIVVCTIL